MKLQFQFNLTFEPTEAFKATLLRMLEQARANPADDVGVPEGFLNAVSKHPAGTDEDVMLQAVVGEIAALILADEFLRFFPSEADGAKVAVSKVQYQECVPPLTPPEGTLAQVININRN